MAKILILGAGIFGSLAARMLQARGHETRVEHRPLVDADDAASVEDAAQGMDAILHTAGPFQRRTEAAARAAAALAIPYVDMSDDRAFSANVRAIEARSPILTGMSTAPALAQALEALARQRDPSARAAAAMYLGGANRQGPASVAFGVGSRTKGASILVDFPGLGRKRAFPARAYFDGDYHVAVGGLPGIGWRFPPIMRAFAPIASRLPRPGSDTAGALCVTVGGAREGVIAREQGQRIAILPAIWAIEEALAARAPHRATLPAEWVDPERLVAFLISHGIERVSE